MFLESDANTFISAKTNAGEVINFCAPSPSSMRRRMQYCTLAGVDESVCIDSLLDLVAEFPYAELGVLYRKERQGRGRYPSANWILELCNKAARRGDVRLALHLCGEAVDDLIADVAQVTAIARRFPRIQLNFRAEKYPLHFVCDLFNRFGEHSIITQHNPENRNLWRSLSHCRNHSILFDQSDGRGIQPRSWMYPLCITSEGLPFKVYDPLCGYSGGLSPTSITTHLKLVNAVTDGKPFWINIESGLRNREDKFEILLARRFLERVEDTLTLEERATNERLLYSRSSFAETIFPHFLPTPAADDTHEVPKI